MPMREGSNETVCALDSCAPIVSFPGSQLDDNDKKAPFQPLHHSKTRICFDYASVTEDAAVAADRS
jgi:hypothetical protein